MAALIEQNLATGYCEFAIQTVDEIDMLPTTTERGKKSLDKVLKATEGSLAFLPDFTAYKLAPTGWAKV
jgi:hypothetical protein